MAMGAQCRCLKERKRTRLTVTNSRLDMGMLATATRVRHGVSCSEGRAPSSATVAGSQLGEDQRGLTERWITVTPNDEPADTAHWRLEHWRTRALAGRRDGQ